jgi:hypothetical protein
LAVRNIGGRHHHNAPRHLRSRHQAHQQPVANRNVGDLDRRDIFQVLKPTVATSPLSAFTSSY